MVRIVPPDGADWTLDAEPIDGGVGLIIAFDLGGEHVRLTLGLDRPDSRVLARRIFACGGDAGERTFTGGSGKPDMQSARCLDRERE